MRKILKSKRTIVMLLSLMAVMVCSVGMTMALLSATTGQLTNTFELGNVTTEVKEEFKQASAYVFDKTPRVVNTGENDCYVRVRVTMSPKEQLEISGWDTTNWVYNETDGYYYYQHVLKADPAGGSNGDTTTNLFTTVKVKEEYQATIESFEVTVYQEAVQAKLNAADGSYTEDMMTIWAAYDSNEVPSSFN